MLFLGPIGLAAPLALLGLLALPLLWLLLRTLPPPARLQRFPPVSLFGGLRNDETEASTIPLWLKLLRILAVAAAIVGFSDPVFVSDRRAMQETGLPALVLVDGSWAGAASWTERVAEITAVLEQGKASGVPVFVLVATALPDEFSGFGQAGSWLDRLAGISPRPWLADGHATGDWIEARIDGRFDSYWISDGLEYAGRDRLTDMLLDRGLVTLINPAGAVEALGVPRTESGEIVVPVKVPGNRMAREITIDAIGTDQGGITRTLDSAAALLDPGQETASAVFRLPVQLRNRIQRFEIRGVQSAGAVSLVADSLQRRKTALVAGRQPSEGGTLLSPPHYLRRAFSPFSELIEGSVEDVLESGPDIVVLTDSVQLQEPESTALGSWVEGGGLLVRFAGPRLAIGSAPRGAEDLFPVRLRSGSRLLGGAMSWDQPKRLREFAAASPFFRLAIPNEITVSQQALAQPGPGLVEKTLAELADGTPLVTGAGLGAGQIVLFHIPANAEWSNLPLSGLFPEMLERLALSSRAGPPAVPPAGNGAAWLPDQLTDAFGKPQAAAGASDLSGSAIAAGAASPEVPPGLYRTGQLRAAVNAVRNPADLMAASWPTSVEVRTGSGSGVRPLKGALLAVAILLFLVEAWATFRLGGRIVRSVAAAAALPACMLALADGAEAQLSEQYAIEATRDSVLAYIVTGDPELDRISRAGLRGLSIVLENRTSVELSEPMGIDPADGAMAVFPLVYWPVSPAGPAISEESSRNLRNYLEGGGMILFDTRDALLGGYSAVNSNAELLAKITAPLAIPPLDIPSSAHALSRSFYLLDQFPGRYRGDIWVEHSPAGESGQGAGATGTDGVTPVVIGGNDWASAWAIYDDGTAMFPVGPIEPGAGRRELAFRFGVNLVMHALTGNYKRDQHHIEALLQRRVN